MTEKDVLRLIGEVEAKAQRAQDRGLESGAPTDIVSAQLALGCRRGMAELRRLMSYQLEAEQRVLAAQQAAAERRTAKRGAGKLANVHSITPTGTAGQ